MGERGRVRGRKGERGEDLRERLINFENGRVI